MPCGQGKSVMRDGPGRRIVNELNGDRGVTRRGRVRDPGTSPKKNPEKNPAEPLSAGLTVCREQEMCVRTSRYPRLTRDGKP